MESSSYGREPSEKIRRTQPVIAQGEFAIVAKR